ncbi:PBP1A family penicillin-binding protein [Secundilactobacillus malefermentans]|uniref:PBP1A family penicillin-binding protein n=1 Tax=Secundilactobacillus malefermentans TaxID=176292 RepID=UPI0011C80FFD|nr:PBP1A family penicillin-binding protein [Secundilactobacillus malefermentans]QEA32395.1 penicillin-binding protein [Secundilactobacillus malefermentans]
MSTNNSKQPTRMSRNSGQRFSSKPKHGWQLFRKIMYLVFAALFVVILAGIGLFFFYAQSAPEVSHDQLASDTSTRIYDSSGSLVSKLGAQDRDYVKNKNIPGTLKQAVVSIEDKRFYKHHGVDPTRIMGAAVADLTGNSLGLQGGSTLTQQLVKLSVFSTAASDRTLKRKAQEAWLAIQVERNYSKAKILEFYINKVYMGNGVYGMQTAAKYYYGKTLSNLTLPQLALLAGMPQSPTSYDPVKYPKYATQRRNTVLTAMVSNNVITSQQAAQAKATNVSSGLVTSHTTTSSSLSKNSKVIDSYLKTVYSELKKRGYNTNTGGLKVYTNLNLKTQKHLYNTVNNDSTVAFPSNKFQVGATMVNSKNGKVVAMLGGRKVGNVSFGLNRAVQTDRSSGSTMKPLMDYGPAIEYLNYPTYQPVQDTAYTYAGTNKQLYDFDNKYQGTITMRKALVESRNIPAVRTLEAVGISKATKFLGGLGMTFKDQLTLQNGIGAYISSEQEAAAYAAFANGGVYHKPYLISKVTTSDGKSKTYSSKGKRAMSKATAFMITDMLKGVMTNASGSGTAANISGLYQAGKTGTTAYPSNYSSTVPSDAAMDSWFTGYTKNYSLSVWTGYDRQFKTGHYIPESETKIAQLIYKSEMTYAQQNKSNTNWTAPSDVVGVTKNGTQEYYVSGHPGTSAIADSGTTNQYSSSNNTSSSRYSSNSQTTGTSESESSTESSTDNESSTSTEQEPGGSGNGTGSNDTSSANSTSNATSTENSPTTTN